MIKSIIFFYTYFVALDKFRLLTEFWRCLVRCEAVCGWEAWAHSDHLFHDRWSKGQELPEERGAARLDIVADIFTHDVSRVARLVKQVAECKCGIRWTIYMGKMLRRRDIMCQLLHNELKVILYANLKIKMCKFWCKTIAAENNLFFSFWWINASWSENMLKIL